MPASNLNFFHRNAIASPDFRRVKCSMESTVTPPVTLNGRYSIVLDITSASGPERSVSVLSHDDNALKLEDDEGSFTRLSGGNTFDSADSIDAEHGHDHTPSRNALYDLESAGGIVTLPSAVLYRFKDLPLVPHQNFTRPSSATTSVSMYSTSTLSETEFIAFTVDLVSPPAAFFHSTNAGCGQPFSGGTPYTPATRRPVDLDLEHASFLDLSAASTAPPFPPDRA
ncbi:hypothetical protein C0991_011026 [Blastosporella zonata]|nr:hypothetical protein C0991_011026 [Blastosporella zonata]